MSIEDMLLGYTRLRLDAYPKKSKAVSFDTACRYKTVTENG